jgi:small redox-active disulfide protein 2
MKLKIYGSGCAKCKQLTANAEIAAAKLGIDFEIEAITDMNDIIDAGVMRTPALAINDDIVVEGKVPDSTELEVWLGLSIGQTKPFSPKT